ncbi:14245_t:CDS:1, partial [Funneliformis mosseae]
MPYVSQEKCSRIYTLYKEGYSTRTIAKMEMLAHHQFYEYIKKEQLEVLMINPNRVIRVSFMDIMVTSGKCSTAVE